MGKPKIWKNTYRVTVLSEGHSIPPGVELEDVLRDMTYGDLIGEVEFEGAVAVPRKNLQTELVKIGNDGTFFGED